MISPDEALFWLALESTPGLGPETARRLLDAFPKVSDIFGASVATLTPIVGARIASQLSVTPEPETHQSALAWLSAPDNHLIPLTHTDYPDRLRQLADAPPWLYVKGDPSLLNRPTLAIVGSRNATPQGRRDAQAFAATLAEAGWVVASGLAEGIDAAAHEGSLGTGESIAVVGTGLDRVYPAKHRDLAHRIAAKGALVSEFALGTPPRPGHFPRRNRIISGLSRGVLVIEAALESGSLITAKLAADQGCEVFALPGSIHSPLSKGCHHLIKQGAKLVESAQDILEELNWPRTAPVQPRLAAEHNDGLLSQLGPEPCSLDSLVERTGLTVENLSAMLLLLELEGRVAVLPGERYQRLY